MKAGSNWWTRRTRGQKTGLLVAVGAAVIVAIIAPVSDKTADVTTSSSTLSAVASASSSSMMTASSLAASSATTVTTTQRAGPSPTSTTSLVAPTTLPLRESAQVIRVVDGDTILVASSKGQEEVRLIGIDTPEAGEAFADEARAALRKLVEGATVYLETDAETRDQYGRLLAYVWFGDQAKKMANLELLKQGLATIYTLPPNVMWVDSMREVQEEAQAAKRGLWGEPRESPLRIVKVEYDAPGDDSLSLNEEYVTFEVLVSDTLLGYSVEDETGHRYSFPDRVLKKGDIFKLHSGQGQDTQTDLYWGASGAAIWNNDGDMVKVLDQEDKIVENYQYK